jgi:hypothetical protein
MKGEVLEPHTGWRGNPAKLARRHAADGTGDQATSAVQDNSDSFRIAAE